MPDVVTYLPPPLLPRTEDALDYLVDLSDTEKEIVAFEAANDVIAGLATLPNYQPTPGWKEMISA